MAIIEGTGGNDRISTKTTVPGQPFATNLDDILNGYGGDDLLNGAGGADVMTGGTGNDRYYVDNVGDQVVENDDEGIDGVHTTLSTFSLGANVEGLRFIGSGDFEGIGNELANRLVGGSGDDTLDAKDSNDRLDGAAGADEMIGGRGDDRYYVDNVGDIVTEAEGEGSDSVYTTLSTFSLGAHVERLRFIGSGDFDGTGNGLANRLVGGSGDDTLDAKDGNDRLDGAAGADEMIGGRGDDRYYVDNVGDVVTEAEGEGSDSVYTTLLTFSLGANVEGLRFIGTGDFDGVGNQLANRLIGGSGDDTLDARDGNDKLDGGVGADEMIGGRGDDRYYVDNVGDVVTEAEDEGVDGVHTTLSTFSLGANIEGLKFTGPGDFVGVGNGLANKLYGGSGNDELYGEDGNDRLFGGAGTDVMIGGLGDDRYYVDDGGDAVIEAANQGTDTVYASADFALIPGQSIENLYVSGTEGLSLAGNELANYLLGGIGDDTLNSGGGNDKINGGIGADIMAGGTGDDVYYVDNASDIVVEELGEGLDTVYATADYELTAGYEVEILRVKGSDGLALIGNEFDNMLIGGVGDDFLDGGAGADLLKGGVGDDFLDGGTGADRLEGGAGDDTLVDCECDFDDTLMGGAGMDFLSSGGGADRLSGGADADVFVYLETTDSTHDRRDTILDFNPAEDILEFSMLAGGNSFHELVTVTTEPTTIDAFTLLAFVSGGDTILYVNNTDAAQPSDEASMEILFQGLTTLTDSDIGYYELLV